MHHGVDYFGNDLPGGAAVRVTDSPAGCCSLCRENTACRAWGWNRGDTPQSTQYRHMCFLKARVGTRLLPNPAVVSGVDCSGLVLDAAPDSEDAQEEHAVTVHCNHMKRVASHGTRSKQASTEQARNKDKAWS
jgi:hypothetical protein